MTDKEIFIRGAPTHHEQDGAGAWNIEEIFARLAQCGVDRERVLKPLLQIVEQARCLTSSHKLAYLF